MSFLGKQVKLKNNLSVCLDPQDFLDNNLFYQIYKYF